MAFGCCTDLGPLVNDLEEITQRKKGSHALTLATHYLQYMYVSFSGFRWPVAYYGTNNVNGHSIYMIMWPLLDELTTYGFNVHGILMDGSANNRQFTRLVLKPENARMAKYCIPDINNLDHQIAIVQDIKHVLKKICNSLYSSSMKENSPRKLMYNGKMILWEHWEDAYAYNCSHDLRIYRKLSKEHIQLSAQSKMRNHLALNVLNADMLHLMCTYQSTVANSHCLDSTIALLKQTSILVEIFSNNKSKVDSMDDVRIMKILQVLKFFHEWEKSFEHLSFKDKSKYLITRETREDLDSALYGFIEIVRSASLLNVPIIPGYFNSDLIENWFCQIRGLRNGMNSNPTLSQIGPSINSNIITGDIISSKGNSSGTGQIFTGVMPPKKCMKK